MSEPFPAGRLILEVRHAVEKTLEVAARRAFRKAMEDFEDRFVASIPKPRVSARMHEDGSYSVEVTFPDAS